MKYNIILIITSLLIIVSCSQKTSDMAMDKVDEEKAVSTETSMSNEDFRKNVPAPGPAPKINISEAETFDLPNGLKVILVENHKLPQVSFQLRLINEPIREADKIGKVSMTGDILARGTTSRSKSEIDESIDYIGASLSSYSNGIFASSLKKHQGRLLEVMADVLYNPVFPEEELEKIKTQSLSALETSKTDPNAIANNISSKILYGADHPYGEIQTSDHVKAIEIEDLKSYYRQYYVPTNAYLIIVGDIDAAEAKGIGKKYFSKWSGNMPKRPARRSVPTPDKQQVSFSHKDGAVQSVIIFGNTADIKPGDEDAIPARVLNSILGTGLTSRLEQNLREDKAYTYAARSSMSVDPLIGSFTASASTRSEVTDSALVQLIYELERIRTEPVDEKELQGVKNFMTGGFARSLESPQTIARFAYNIARYNLPADYYQTYLQKLNAVSSADVMAMAKKYIHPDKASIIVVGNKDDVAEKLLPFDSDGKLSMFDAFGNEMQEKAVPLPAGVTANQIIGDYLNAIGGADKIASLKSLYVKMTTNAMGQDLVIESYQKGDDRLAIKFGNGAMVFQEQKYDGAKAAMIAMGQSQVFTEGPMFQELKNAARIVPQRYYAKEGAVLDLKGIESVEGQQAYKVVVTMADGATESQYFSVSSGLHIRTSKNQEGPQGTVSITSDFADYKDIGNGIMYPSSTSVTGMLPGGGAMVMKVVETTPNVEVGDEVFEIEE